MRNSLSMIPVRACAAGTLLLSLSLTPALAHMAAPLAGPAAQAGMAPGHFAPLGFRGFNRFGANRFRFNGFRFDRFEGHRFGFNRFGFNGFGENAGALDFGLLGLDGWGYGGYPPYYPTAPAGPIIIGARGPPVAINVYAGGGGAGDPGAGGGGACPVLHQLHYDNAGHYIGERQIPAC